MIILNSSVYILLNLPCRWGALSRIVTKLLSGLTYNKVLLFFTEGMSGKAFPQLVIDVFVLQRLFGNESAKSA